MMLACLLYVEAYMARSQAERKTECATVSAPWMAGIAAIYSLAGQDEGRVLSEVQRAEALSRVLS